jgi:hypothetical protein
VWLSSSVLALARAGFDSIDRATETLDNLRLAILADALEDAGCTDTDILAHLRGPGPHVSGCWVLDLLMDRQ